MTARNFLDLLILGMLWGISFLFIRVAVPDFGAVPLMTVRVVLAAAILVPLMLARRQWREVLQHWPAIVLMGIVHYAIPFILFAYSMLTLTAGYSSIINASSPLFAGAVAWFWLQERPAASRIAGLLTGFAGVVVLVWDKLIAGIEGLTLAALASLLAAFCYGFAAVMARKKLAGVKPIAVAGGSMAAATMVLLPFAIWLWPYSPPSATAWGMAATLGVVCTALAFVLYFRLIANIGPSRAITVTFLIPLFAVVAGWLVLDEAVTGGMVAGGTIVVMGTALSTGLIDPSQWRSWLQPRVMGRVSLVLLLALGAVENARATEAQWSVSTPPEKLGSE